jgi:xylulokinase
MKPLYLGFDLSTQQLKCLAVSSDLKVEASAIFDFDKDSHGYSIHKGVIVNDSEHEVYAPVALWLQALDSVLERLKDSGVDFSRIRGISCAGQQHGSVYWAHNASSILQSLDPTKTLEDQLQRALSHSYSPNWQDASTSTECAEFDALLGSPEQLAQTTGSKAPPLHRTSNTALPPQISRCLRPNSADIISLVLSRHHLLGPLRTLRH